MTIANKIIFSSTLVAMIAALATFMGWKNTQPIKAELAETLHQTTEEIQILDEVESRITKLQADVFVVVKDLNTRSVNDLEAHKKRGLQVNKSIEDLKERINDFSGFNVNAIENSSAIGTELILLCNEIQMKVKHFFPASGPLPTRSTSIGIAMGAKKMVDDFSSIVQVAKKERYELIKEEGQSVKAQVTTLNFWILLCGGLTFLLAIVFGQLIARNLSSAIENLRTAARQLNKGDYTVRVGSSSTDEFGRLGQTFDGMAANLQQSKTIEDQKLEVERLNGELKLKNDSLDSFVYRVSHDLKAPVVNIKSLLQLIKVKVAKLGTSELDQPFSFLDDTVGKLEQTIVDLLEVSRIEQSLTSDNEWINLEEKLEMVKLENSQSIQSSQVKITKDFKVPELYFSKANLNSILSNLITNSIKYSSRLRSPEIHISTMERDGFVCLEISDNGIGMDLEKHKDKLFGMFNRFHNHVEGSGVGLYIVKKIMETAGGKVEVESKVERGTRFRLFFNQQNVPASIELQ